MKVLALIACALSLGACASLESGSSCVVDDAYFQAHRKLAWEAPFGRISQDPLDAVAPVTLEQIRLEIQRQLEALGFTFSAQRNDAQMLVSFVVATRQEVQAGAYAYSDGYWWGVYRHPVLVVHDPIERREAYLAIDLTEAASQRALWRGWAQQSVTPADRSDPTPLIRKAVASILAELPRAARPQR